MTGFMRLTGHACCVLFLFAFAVTHYAVAQDRARAETVPALMVSDIHLDPFYDPAKAKQLVAAPANEWGRILNGPDSPGRAEAYAALQKTCSAKGADTSNLLFQSSLRAMRAQGANARFVTVSGDLIAHQFPCRFHATVPDGTPDEYAAFVEKTIDYVLTGLRRALPGVPVYAALGNNDSGCADYRMDTESSFLRATAQSVLRGLPASAEKQRALADFAEGGYYSVTMAAPMRRTRLIVLNDLFMSRNYATCEGKADPAAGEAQLAWLGKQLADARARGQRVWVMGHIPPGVDIHSAALHLRKVCNGASPQMFLTSEKLAGVLEENADVVRLGVFAHTHMDELRLLAPEDAPKQMVAIKMVPSITPVHGNNPAFVVARVSPASAELKDYSVFAASNTSGVRATWSKEYTYSSAYHESAFAPAQVAHLVKEFAADPEAKSPESKAFIQYFYAGDTSGLIKPLWPEYVCALAHTDGASFAKCACTAEKRSSGE
ncbi:hypothetical protein GCM10011507_22400 [Edaphobacter acidisoli]|uniref:Calcineurin-like phosphoesterase domain-containing protein n=1 Tax=Edaphobacter acidisoli TaxID=2040573 RepID=A0A916RUI8_9BACT|nr:metallophosphoesterase [Edaphobacter acidisoli]GGA70387.1 hypothetical protein GCM10011507_22400 [Edaphobacter acidisoli]